ncbi:MAG: SPFH domain-containing protein [Planctomycetota bacterium]|jgi:membrane protease subunit HflC
MSKPLAIVAGLLLLVLLVLFSTTFTVRFNEVAIKTTFGKVGEGSIVDEPGLHFKLPFFADRVTKYDTRLQLIQSIHDTIPTADGQQVVVNAFLLWRVDTDGEGPLDFFRGFRSAQDARESLVNEFRHAMSAISAYRFDDLIGEDSRLPDAEAAIMAGLQSVRAKGVLPVTVGISQLMLPPKITTGVLERMSETRKTLSGAERYKGRAEAERIQSDANIKAQKIGAFAEQRAAEIRAAGDALAAGYLTDMSVDEEFAIFLVWLDALEQSLATNTTVILPTAFEPFHLLNMEAGAGGPIPQPAEALVGPARPAGPEPAPEPIALDDEAPAPGAAEGGS